MTEQPWYAEHGFTDAEWGLIVGLPQSVLAAASAAESDGARRTMAENAAGLDAIAAGRESGVALVEAVAQEIVARIGDPEEGEELPSLPPTAAPEVLERARDAARLLAARVDEGEAGAYKHWLVGIAEQVGTAAPIAGVPGDEVLREHEREFRDELRDVLQD